MNNVSPINDRIITDVDAGGMPDPKVRDEITELIDRMEQSLKDGVYNEPDCPVIHHFSDGVYAREIFMPKGSLVIGKIHKTSHLNIISKGKVTVRTQFGINEYTAPHTFRSPIGAQKAVYCHEDTVWTTIHPTEETDLEKIEKHVIAESYDEIPGLYGPQKPVELEGDK